MTSVLFKIPAPGSTFSYPLCWNSYFETALLCEMPPSRVLVGGNGDVLLERNGELFRE